MATRHLFAAAMVWYDEPVKLHIHLPIGTQVRDYMATRGRWPSGNKVQIPGGEVVSQSSLTEPHPEWGPWPSGSAQLREALEELQLETARREGWHPHLGHPWAGGRSLQAAVKPTWMMGKWHSKGEGWEPSKPVQ